MIYARKCSVTGKGMNEGWFIYEEYYSDISMAEEIAKENGFKEEIFFLEDGTELLIRKV